VKTKLFSRHHEQYPKEKRREETLSFGINIKDDNTEPKEEKMTIESCRTTLAY